MAQSPRSPDDVSAKDVTAETEQSVIGALFLDQSRFAEVAKLIGPDDFRDRLHGVLFSAIAALVRLGQPVDPVTVRDWLEREGHDEYADGATQSYVASLVVHTPSAANVLRYAEIVRERARQALREFRVAQAGPADDEVVERGGRLFFKRDGMPVVRVRDGFLHEAVDQAEQALMEARLGIYQREKMLVRVVKRMEPSIRNYSRPPGVVGIAMVDLPFLVEQFTRCAVWQKWDNRTNGWRRMNAPDKVAATYLSRVGQWRVPHLWDTITAPTLRPDGTVLQTPGYDERTHIFYDPCGVSFPEIPDRPTRQDAEQAYQTLRDALATFPFASRTDADGRAEVDEAVALAAILTAVVRRSLESAPLIAIDASVPNSGKTLLATGIGMIATGSRPSTMTFAETDEEAKKTALAVLVESDQVVLIDNVERPLEGEWLNMILTGETFTQRVLGRTEMMTMPTRMLWIATGNHLQVVGDMRSRALLCELDAQLENPGERVFEEDFKETVQRRRTELVAAALTLMRAFIVSGARAGVSNWGRFEGWSQMVRAPLVWIGADDPCASIKKLEGKDPSRSEHLRFLTLWWECFGDGKQTSAQALEWLGLNGGNTFGDRLMRLFGEIATDRSGQVTAKRLSGWIRRRVGARVGGFMVEHAGELDHVALWRVTKEGR